MNLTFKAKRGTDPKYGKYTITTESKDGEIIQSIKFSTIPDKQFRLNKMDEELYFNIPYPYPKKSVFESFDHDFSKMIRAIKDGYADTIILWDNSILGMNEYPIYFLNRDKGMEMRKNAEAEFLNAKLCYAIRVVSGFGSRYLFDPKENGKRLEFETPEEAEKYIHDDIMSWLNNFDEKDEELNQLIKDEYDCMREKYDVVCSICTKKDTEGVVNQS